MNSSSGSLCCWFPCCYSWFGYACYPYFCGWTWKIGLLVLIPCWSLAVSPALVGGIPVPWRWLWGGVGLAHSSLVAFTATLAALGTISETFIRYCVYLDKSAIQPTIRGCVLMYGIQWLGENCYISLFYGYFLCDSCIMPFHLQDYI